VRGGVTSAILNVIMAEDAPGPGTVDLGSSSPARHWSAACGRTSPWPDWGPGPC